MRDYKKEFYKYVENTGEYECKGEYTSARNKVEIKHFLCGKSWNVSPNNFKNKGSRCPYCYGNARKTNNDFIRELNEIKELKDYLPLEKYKGTDTPIKVKHLTCGNQYKVTPYKILKEGTRCPYCSGRTGHDYKARCEEELGNEYSVLNNPEKHISKVKVFHHKCKNEYLVSCNKVLMGRKCPYCKSSKLEKEVRDILSDLNILFKEQYRISDCKNILPLPFDFALDIDSKLILIECQGIQHYEETNFFGSLDSIKNRDTIKKEYCKNKNITLIEIPYFETNIKDKLLTEINIQSEHCRKAVCGKSTEYKVAFIFKHNGTYFIYDEDDKVVKTHVVEGKAGRGGMVEASISGLSAEPVNYCGFSK